jgi:hypothetical protein
MQNIIMNRQAIDSKQTAAALWIPMDMLLGHSLDEFLFKLCGTDQVVWIPEYAVSTRHLSPDHYLISIDTEASYCCARITISNTIRMCLTDQHQVSGRALMPYLCNDLGTSFKTLV